MMLSSRERCFESIVCDEGYDMSSNVNHGTRIKVITRVRPLLPRELKEGAEKATIVRVLPDGKTLELRSPMGENADNRITGKGGQESTVKRFIFDESLWSFDRLSSTFIDNSKLYGMIGPGIIEDLFRGYNMCLLAYGQTSSGKTHTMTGDAVEPGIILLMMKDLLKLKQVRVAEKVRCDVHLSYIEIYNEKVRDLLDNVLSDKTYRVREHPDKGPYVEDVYEHKIESYDDFLRCLHRGSANRSTAATDMNDKSSRSHAIIKIILKQTKFSDVQDDQIRIGEAEEVVTSNIKFVDLAGSERLKKTQLFGQLERMREGAQINKSLTTLGRCINILSSNETRTKVKPKLIPYRDSTLTYLLKENLGGNSKSFMIFCISPLDYEESLQTLNYAKQVKNIKTSARANKANLDIPEGSLVKINAFESSLIESLQNEIKEITNKMKELEKYESGSISSSNDKFDKLISFLQMEHERTDFENKFLRSKIELKDREIDELKAHVRYTEYEYSDTFKIQSSKRIAKERSTMNDFLHRCDLNMKDLEKLMEEFDPRKL